jgi:hypothetical protein
MSSFSDPVPFPEPAWLTGHSDPFVDALLSDLTDETRQLYRRYLGAEVRAMRPDGRSPAWRAFDRTLLEVMRRRQEPPGS